MPASSKAYSTAALAVVLCLSSPSPAQEPGQSQGRGRGQDPARTRRSQRVVPMREVRVVSPDGQVGLTLGSNPERLTWTVTRVTCASRNPCSYRSEG